MVNCIVTSMGDQSQTYTETMPTLFIGDDALEDENEP